MSKLDAFLPLLAISARQGQVIDIANSVSILTEVLSSQLMFESLKFSVLSFLNSECDMMFLSTTGQLIGYFEYSVNADSISILILVKNLKLSLEFS